jgi:hypothetical protein
MKKSQGLLPLLALVCAAAFAPETAQATVFTVNCGAGGPTTALQAQITSIGSTPGHQINVTGTCVGDIDTSRADRLTISGLTITGSVSMTKADAMRFLTLKLNNGTLLLINTRNTTFSGTTVNGIIQVMRGSQASFNSLIQGTWSDGTGTFDPSFNCIGQSECSINAATITGGGSSSTSIGVLAASASRLNFTSGSIMGFGIGLQAWNNSTAFVLANCDPILIAKNQTAGVWVADSAMVKVAGISKQDAIDIGCPGAVTVDISSNGKFGVYADGGGNAYLQYTRVAGFALDGVRVQNGSVARVQSSKIDAASTSGRSARAKAAAHLYFDEQQFGPGAGSSLGGPVCITGGSTVDTDNSSTVVSVLTSCTGP